MAPATLLKNFDIKFSSQSFPFVKLLLGKENVVVKLFQEKLIFIYFSHQFVSRCSLAKEIATCQSRLTFKITVFSADCIDMVESTTEY